VTTPKPFETAIDGSDWDGQLGETPGLPVIPPFVPAVIDEI
jgi:hypothetical protein